MSRARNRLRSWFHRPNLLISKCQCRWYSNFEKIFSSLFALILLPHSTVAQFGEIASVVSGLLSGGGGGAGLAGLTGGGAGLAGAASGGSGLAGLAGLAGPAAGAAGAFSNLGSLYQLAQAALQLTGTGVGIANQASESAWFPVLIENAAKMNRDFQERLLGGLGGAGSSIRTIKPKISSKGTEIRGSIRPSLGKEYGKNYESSAEDSDEEQSRVQSTLLPSLLPVTTYLGLLPGEAAFSASGSQNGHTETFLPASTTPSSIIYLPKPQTTLGLPKNKLQIEKLSTTESTLDYNENAEINTEKKPSKTLIEQVEFNTDHEFEASMIENEDKRIPSLLPPRASPIPDELSMSRIEGVDEKEGIGITMQPVSHMVPELRKLIDNLKSGNLTKDEFVEIYEQIMQGNEPSENKELSQDLHQGFANKGTTKQWKRIKETERRNASERNLKALRKVIGDKDKKTIRIPKVLATVERPKVVIGNIHNPPSIQFAKKLVYDPSPGLRRLFNSFPSLTGDARKSENDDVRESNIGINKTNIITTPFTTTAADEEEDLPVIDSDNHAESGNNEAPQMQNQQGKKLRFEGVGTHNQNQRLAIPNEESVFAGAVAQRVYPQQRLLTHQQSKQQNDLLYFQMQQQLPLNPNPYQTPSFGQFSSNNNVYQQNLQPMPPYIQQQQPYNHQNYYQSSNLQRPHPNFYYVYPQ